MSCLANGIKHRESYPEDVRNFCISLNNTSPAAYRLLRKEFDENIPCQRTIRAWHANADINVKPGILTHSLEILKRKVEEKALNGDKLIGGILFDEMSIRKMLQWTNNTIIGFELAIGKDQRDAQMATYALVFMFNGVNEDLQLPVAYYFVTSLDANVKTKVVADVLKAVIDCGVEVTSITFDGHRTNPALCGILGANLDVLSDLFNPSIVHEGTVMYIIFDPSHMIKLNRGAIARNMLIDDERKPIKWVYFERLVRFSEQRNLRSMHKMTRAHIDFSSNVMNVKLAVQTLSASTANTMEYLMNQGFSEFNGAEGTIRFIRIINNLFDVFNSTRCSSPKTNQFKNRMSSENIGPIFELFDTATDYITGLKCQNNQGKLIPICKSPLKTGFQGWVVNMRSIRSLYEKYVMANQIRQFPTHSLSQDHIEVIIDNKSINFFNIRYMYKLYIFIKSFETKLVEI